MTDIASELIQQQEKLAGDFSTYHSHCQECAEIMLPRQNDFFTRDKIDGEKRSNKITDGTAQSAAEKFGAIMEELITPRASKWHGLKHPEDKVNEDKSASDFYDRLTNKLFQIRYSPKANFANQQQENYIGLGVFGGAVKLIEEMPGFGIRYKACHISEHFYMENMHGIVDADWRRYKLSARQAAQKFGEINLPQQIKTALDKTPNQKFEFLHCVFPNNERDYSKTGSKNFPFASFHVAIEGKKLLGHGGFRTFPYTISRYLTSPNEITGRSPGMTALAESKMLNSLRKTDLRARHKAVDPIILAADAQTVRAKRMTPNAIVYGGLDASGNALMKPFNEGARIDLSNDAIAQSREFINDVFLINVFKSLIENPQMTATQVLEVIRERNMLVSPSGGRQESEDIGPMIEREIDILSAHGYFDKGGELEMPQVIRDAGGIFEIEYNSPLSRMRKADEALGTQRTVEAALPYAQLNPSILDNFDWDAFVDIVGSANGAPSRLYNSDETKTAIRQGRQQSQQMQTVIAAAPGVAGSLKDIADAQAASRG